MKRRAPHDGVYARIGLSRIHGVGVRAVRDIPAGTLVFQGESERVRWVSRAAVRRMPPAIRALYEDFGMVWGTRLGVPPSLNMLSVGWYVNHSDRPNVEAGDDARFRALRRIRKGEELTADYRTFVDEAIPFRPRRTRRAAIGPVTEEEFDALAALMRVTIEPLRYYNARARRAELARYTADGLRALVAEDPQAVLVARDRTGLIGFCVSRFDDGTIWLSWFATAARARGHGVGASLLAALAKTLRSRHAHKIWCDSRTDNVESRSVLERAGFRRLATLKNHWYGQDYFLWEWSPTRSHARPSPARSR